MLNFKGGARLLFLLSLLALLAAWAGCSVDETTGPTETESGTLSGLITVRCDPNYLDIPWTLTGPDGSSLRASGSQVLSGATAGTYQLSWPSIPGWRSPYPNPQVKELASDGTLDFPGVYVLEPGTFHLRVLPAGIEATWSLRNRSGDEVATGTSDSTVTNLVTGTYRLFMEQFETLRADTLQVIFTGNDQGQSVVAAYRARAGKIVLVPSPAGIQAPWTVTNTNGESYTGAGEATIDVTPPPPPTGDEEVPFFDYTIEWGDLAGYVTPDQTRYFIAEADTLGNYLIAPEYTPEAEAEPAGSVTISGTIGSTAMNWHLEGPGGYSQVGAGDRTISGVAVGPYSVTWLPTPGWTPGPVDNADLANQGSITFVANYEPAITISVMPMEVAGGWQISGPQSFTDSGVGAAHLVQDAAGSYTLTWQEVSGWNTPAAETQTMSQTQGLVFTGTYTRGSETLFIQTYPEDLAATWTLTGPNDFSYSGSGQESVALTTGGTYRIVYDRVEGWLKPASRYFTVDPAATMTLDGTYLPAAAYVAVEPTVFEMGSPFPERCRSFEEELHDVSLTNTYSIMTTEVTNTMYTAAANWALANGYATITGTSLLDNIEGSVVRLLDMADGDNEIYIAGDRLACRNADHPVKEVTWYGAAAYCDWLSLHQGLPRAYERPSWFCNLFGPNNAPGYRLPTEAEWELAARGGSDTAFPNGNTFGGSVVNNTVQFCTWSGLDDIAWWSGNADFWSNEVAQLLPNDWGIYDMHGNVAEWCNDWYDSRYYSLFDPDVAVVNPPGPSTGEARVVRGGYFYSTVEACRSAARASADPATTSYGIGFRVAIRRGAE
jgi:formylglycine-generating enzyme required for sulfatase activity